MCEPYTDIWHFATTVYRQPEVEPLCLQLQEEQGVNVTLLLWLLWIDSYFAKPPASLNAGHLIAEQWQHNIVTPLRTARRWMKRNLELNGDKARLREAIKSQELFAEKLLLSQLQSLVEHTPSHNRALTRVDQLQASADYLTHLGMAAPARASTLKTLLLAIQAAHNKKPC
ncbi:TIGR02444 family protein [Gilvimarinus sp. SDUM040013]|uniref:TIGR02444 family protein n=1 Tax=Gilvimarinus gilvus TaxID=3058038 RepID=A0ABU4S146_9GAMM|nr:TIGR02444 family protein [Gilvimarinus sp. SDUM040013]MDO3388678.1 TIGR02444 family protein [Gilvimarinus sp. SDUM040013]MDX6849573.1 TIGR02444 family protein [Gilvimarinus sp. SDUM040013]